MTSSVSSGMITAAGKVHNLLHQHGPKSPGSHQAPAQQMMPEFIEMQNDSGMVIWDKPREEEVRECLTCLHLTPSCDVDRHAWGGGEANRIQENLLVFEALVPHRQVPDDSA